MERYETEEEIIKDMERAKEKSTALQREAENVEADIALRIKDMEKTGNYLTSEKISYDSKHARDCRKRAASLIDNRLPMLKRVLAVFRTSQLPAIDNGDKSVPARARNKTAPR